MISCGIAHFFDKEAPINTIRADDGGITYHPYVAMVSYFSDAQALQMGQPIYDKIARTFTEACNNYRDNVETKHAAYLRANGIRDRNVKLERHLFNPACSLCFGHADMATIVLLDDFDPFLRLTGDLDLPMKQVSLAFCPRLNSLHLEALPDGTRGGLPSPFVELHDLLGQANIRKGRRAKIVGPAFHPFQVNAPLIAITRFKINGIAILGHGLIQQRAILRTMANRILRARFELWKQRATSTFEHLEIDTDSIRNIYCAFLDSQCSEDIITYISCRNYSVVMSLITALSDLTFKDVIALSDSAKVVSEPQGFNKMHQRIAALADNLETRNVKTRFVDTSPTGQHSLSGNHLFANIHTTLGVAIDVFRHPGTKCRGVIEGYARLNFCPGHLHDVEKCVSHSFSRVKRRPSRTSAKHAIDLSSRCHRIMVGRYDYDLPLAQAPDDPVLVIRTAELFRRQKEFIRAVSHPPIQNYPETGILDMNSGLVVPVPRISGKGSLVRKISQDHYPLIPVLNEISSRLFSPADSRAERRRKSQHSRPTMSVTELIQSMRRLGVPWQLRRITNYIYRNYANCLSDPALFDSVLDLYDTFKAVYIIFTRDLPNLHVDRQSVALPATCIAWPFPESVVFQQVSEELSEFIDAMQNAVAHRIGTRTLLEEYDWAVDFRGGLNKLVAAVDAPLKAAVGLLKWFCREGNDSPIHRRKESFNNTEPVGAVTRLSFHSRASCKHIAFSGIQSGRLVQLDMNAGHIFNPTEFIDYIHEGGHILLEEMDKRDGRPPGRRIAGDSKSRVDEERRSEMFADMITHLFVFGADEVLFRQYNMLRYNMDLISVCEDYKDTTVRLAEVMLRCFVVSGANMHMKRQFGGDPTIWPILGPWGNYLQTHRVATSCKGSEEKLFQMFVNDYGPLFVQFHSLWHGHEHVWVRNLFHRWFIKFFATLAEEHDILWKRAITLYQRFAKSRYPWNVQNGRDQLHEIIMSALEEGRTDICQLFEARQKGELRDPRKRDIDPLILICQLLYAYVRFSDGGFDARRGIHLIRSNGGEIDYKNRTRDGRKGWNLFQLDRSYNRHFCCGPEVRKQRIQREVVVLKALWDISTLFRARRLNTIMDSLWP